MEKLSSMKTVPGDKKVKAPLHLDLLLSIARDIEAPIKGQPRGDLATGTCCPVVSSFPRAGVQGLSPSQSLPIEPLSVVPAEPNTADRAWS